MPKAGQAQDGVPWTALTNAPPCVLDQFLEMHVGTVSVWVSRAPPKLAPYAVYEDAVHSEGGSAVPLARATTRGDEPNTTATLASIAMQLAARRSFLVPRLAGELDTLRTSTHCCRTWEPREGRFCKGLRG